MTKAADVDGWSGWFSKQLHSYTERLLQALKQVVVLMTLFIIIIIIIITHHGHAGVLQSAQISIRVQQSPPD